MPVVVLVVLENSSSFTLLQRNTRRLKVKVLLQRDREPLCTPSTVDNAGYANLQLTLFVFEFFSDPSRISKLIANDIRSNILTLINGKRMWLP